MDKYNKKENNKNKSKPKPTRAASKQTPVSRPTNSVKANNIHNNKNIRVVNQQQPGVRNIIKERNTRSLNIKLVVMLSLFFICFFGLSFRMVYIYVVKGEEYTQRAINQQTNKYDQTIPPVRGSIVDRNKKVLALSTVVYNVILDVRVLHEVNDGIIKAGEENDIIQPTIQKLNEILDIPINELQSYVAKKADGTLVNDKNYLKIATKVSQETVDKLDDAKLRGIWFEKDSERKYTEGTLAPQIIGFIRGGSSWGLERHYNKQLTGMNGRAFITFEDGRDVTNHQVEPVDGYTVVTTLDQTIQKIAEEAIANAVVDFEGQNTSVIVMKPTGEILAMAEYPTFDLNDPMQPKFILPEIGQEFENMSEEEKIYYLNTCWSNFHVSSTFEPGSIFKPITIAAALEENIINVNSMYNCTGGKFVVDTDIPCNSVHGLQTLEQTLANSCNVAMMEIAAKLQKNLFYKYQIDFGFGQETGVDLPAEVSADWSMHTPVSMSPVDLATESFGQTFTATNLQSINAIAAIINGGNLMRPFIVSQIYDQNGTVVYENAPEVQRKVISQQTADIVREFMRSVVDSGTGRKAQIPGYAIGGKTGTAQQGKREDKKYALTYISFLPVDNPQILIMANIYLPKEYVDGVTTPAYLMKEVLENTIKYLGLPPSYRDDEEQQALIADDIILDDYVDRSILDVSLELASKDIISTTTGAGTIITKQLPKGGTPIKPGSKVLFYLQKDEQETLAVKVPNVIGKTYDEAVSDLMSAGLAPVTEFEIKGDISQKIITTQSTNPDMFVEEGTEIILDITENN